MNTTTIRKATPADVPTLAKLAAFGTLKRVHSASASPRITELKQALSRDIHFMENVTEWNTQAADMRKGRAFYNDHIQALTVKQRDALANGDKQEAANIAAQLKPLILYRDNLSAHIAAVEKQLDYSVTDAADLYHVAVADILDRINGGAVLLVKDTPDGVKLADDCDIYASGAENTVYTRITRKGESKARNVFQMACIAVRAAIYANRGILEGSNNYTYLEDMTQSDDSGNSESAENVVDRVYIRSGKWYDMPSIIDYETQAALLRDMRLTDTQATILHYRLQGFSNVEIAKKRGVDESTIREHLKAIGKKYNKIKA